MDLPLKVAYRFSRLLDSADSAMKQFTHDRKPLFEKYGEDVKNPEGIQTGRAIPPENQDEFNVAQDALLNVEVDIWFEPVPLADMGDIRLTAQDMTALKPFIVGGDE